MSDVESVISQLSAHGADDRLLTTDGAEMIAATGMAGRSGGSESGAGDDDDDDDMGLPGLEWNASASVIDKIMWIAEFPFSLMRNATIAPADQVEQVPAAFCGVRTVGAVIVVLLDFSPNWSSDQTVPLYGPSWQN